MRNRGKILLLVLGLMLFAGCGSNAESDIISGERQIVETSQAQANKTISQEILQPGEKSEALQATESAGARKAAQETEALQTPETVQASEPLQENGASEGDAAQSEDAEDAAMTEEEVERELTEQEIKKLQWSLRASDNGFFACTYYRPEEIDWQQVFYLGAGYNITLDEGQLEMIRETMREKIRQERAQEEELWELYLVNHDILPEEEEEEAEEEEIIEVNLTASQVTTLTLRSIQNFVKNRTGIEYSEARKPLDWPTLSRNVFYFVHEDSNKVQVKLLSGTVRGNEYRLYYRLGNKRGATDPEYVMTVEIDGSKWKYKSNLSLKEAEPVTLLDIEYFSGRELARLQGVKEMIVATSEAEETQEAEQNSSGGQKSGKNSSGQNKKAQQDTFYWAVITAREDNTKLTVEKAYLGDEISSSLAEEGFFIAGESLYSITLQKGEKIGIRVTLEDIPKLRIWAISGCYYGEYAFGSENRLGRTTEEGLPAATYVAGYDFNNETKSTQYHGKEELLAFLKGTWVYYDSMQGEYTAELIFDGANGVTVSFPGLSYLLTISKWNRVYADEGEAPDVMTFQTVDERTQELIAQWYPVVKRKMGDYRLRVIQRDGMQILYLTPENTGVGCLNFLLPGAEEDTDEFVFYRFYGASEEAPEEVDTSMG